jgi:hypothetical protein
MELAKIILIALENAHNNLCLTQHYLKLVLPWHRHVWPDVQGKREPFFNYPCAKDVLMYVGDLFADLVSIHASSSQYRQK